MDLICLLNANVLLTKDCNPVLFIPFYRSVSENIVTLKCDDFWDMADNAFNLTVNHLLRKVTPYILCNGARARGLWLILQGALVVCDCERNAYIKVDTRGCVKRKGEWESKEIQESYIEILPPT